MKKGFYCLFIALLMSSCATQKSKSDQSGISRLYHNTTSRFNGYFNANEIMEETIALLNDQHQDNFNEILEIYPYRVAQNPESVASQLDEAIKKVSVVATLHDNSDWVDDCYLLIAKAEYLKQDYESAQGALEFFMDEFGIDGKRLNTKPSKKSSKSKKNNSEAKKSKKSNKKSSDQRAKEAERDRKAYNKALRKKQKRSAKGKSTDDIAVPSARDDMVTSKRSTSVVTPPPVKKEEKPKKPPEAVQNPGGLKHRPAHQEAQLWLARTYIERENYPRAEYHMNNLAANAFLQDEVKRELPAVRAYYAIHRDNPSGAIPHLEQAIELSKDRETRARYAFILAQIAELDEHNSSKAYTYFKNVLTYKPSYDLEFNTKMSMARTSYLSGTASLESSIDLLNKMLKDDKNADYLDRIYYTFARIDLLRQDTDAAIANLQLAVAHQGQNQAQQTETNHLLATLYFDKGMYVEAKQAFDAALQTMKKEDERYAHTQLLSENLTAIAEHLQTITLQDSLLRISGMTDGEKKILARGLVEAKAAALSSAQGQGTQPNVGAAKGAGGQFASTNATAGGPVATPVLNTSVSSSFFAYDQRIVRRGERDFARVWGSRPLADNWRVSSKIGTADDLAGPQDPILVARSMSDEELMALLKDVPDTEAEIETSKEAIRDAMLQLGILYREKLEQGNLSTEVLEDLVTTYPQYQGVIDAYYQLYLSYLYVNNDERAEYYRNLIIDRFPTSKYALAMTDPDYLERRLQEERKLEIHYEKVYAMVENEDYEGAMATITAGKASYGTRHEFQGRIAILEAMCTGHKDGKDAYVQALRNVIAQFPGTPEETKARDMLLLLGEYQNDRLNLQRGSTANSSGASSFRVQPNSVHYLLVMVENFEEITTKDAKLAISNFNRKYFKLDRLKISSLVFDPATGQSVILVRSFKSAEESIKYLNSVNKNGEEFLPPTAKFEAFPVSQFNYREVVKQRSLDNYKSFYSENYSD